MGIEIERKYLVDNEAWAKIEKPAGIHYIQGYILNDDQRTIRIRISGKTGYINFKGPTKGYSRAEFEYEIPLADGIELMKAFTVSKVEKTRFCIDINGKTWETDVFHGDNEGLITAELELTDENEDFELPEWVTKEVSDDHRYANSSLAINPFKNW